MNLIWLYEKDNFNLIEKREENVKTIVNKGLFVVFV